MYGCREILRPPVQMQMFLCEPTVISCLEWIKYLDAVSVNFRGFLSSTTIGGVVMTVWATIFEQCITLTTRNLCLLILISFVKDCISASTLDRRETLCLSDSWVAAAAIVACTTITPPSPSFECLSPKVYVFASQAKERYSSIQLVWMLHRSLAT